MIPQRTGIGHPILLLLFLCLALSARAAVLRVPEEWLLIQTALDSCASGDTILVAPGEYHGNFVVPDRTITLGSQTLLTGDTLYIPQTILDGDSLGTVLTVRTGSAHRFILNGFWIRNGLGGEWVSAGIHFADSTDTELYNLHFSQLHGQNNAVAQGLAVYGSIVFTGSNYGIKSIVMDGFRFFGINNHYSATLIYITSRSDITAKNIIFDHMQSRLMRLGSPRSFDLENILVQDGNFPAGAILAGNGLVSHLNAGSHHRLNNIKFIRNQYKGYLLAYGATANSDIENLSFIDNVEIEPRTDVAVPFAFTQSGYSLQARSLVFRGNRGLRQYATVGEIHAIRVDGQPSGYSEIDGLVVENCILGDSNYTYWDGAHVPTMLLLENVSLKNARFANNTTILTPGEHTSEYGEYNARLLKVNNWCQDSILFKNVTFIDNTVIDRDNYDEIPLAGASMGRCLYMMTGPFHSFLMDSVTFIRNRQPNMSPEGRGNAFTTYSGTIGSVMELDNGLGDVPGDPVKVLRNLLFLDNDDGGIQTVGGGNDCLESRLAFENVQMIHMSRQAMDIRAKSVTLDNVLIDGCTPALPLSNRSEQMPVRLTVAEPSTVRNCTVINTTTPYVVMAGLTPYQEERLPLTTFENCLFANNPCDRFEAEVVQYDYPGWDSFRPGRYNYCLLPEAMTYGEQNLVGVPPLFDAALGSPYLDPTSPCVDAGNPDPVRNDLEDPANPGFPLWPSLGSLRNDIGFTGGPYAACRDTTWSALPDWEPRLQPTAFTLSAPWPNPFNPATQIPFTLAHPARVRLSVFNLLGQEVAVLVDGPRPAGTHRVLFTADRLASGLYLVTLEAGGHTVTRAVTLLR